MKTIINNKDFTEVARNCFTSWNQSLQTGEPKKVAILYSDEVTFHATLSGVFRHTFKEVEEYFAHFLKNHPIGKIIEDSVQVINDACFIHSGLYDFEIGQEDNRITVQARFTFIWQKNEAGDWKIIHHHSSVLPK